MQIIGQEQNLKLIDSWKELPNFIIIQGDEHTGKRYLTLYLSEKFNCQYEEVKKNVSEVRLTIKEMVRDYPTLYHFDNFHTASLQAKNALLKITEEPIPGNHIVITGASQLKTLESRARRIIMAPYSSEEMYEYMQPYFSDRILQDKLIGAGINTPAKVNYYKDYEHIEALLDFSYDIFAKITYITPETVLNMLKRFENRYDNIDAFLLFLTMLINIIENNIKTKSYASYKDILYILLEGKKQLIRQPTLKRKLLVYEIFYDIYKLNKR